MFATRESSDVEANVALEIGPEKLEDNIGQCSFGSLVRSSRAFIKEFNNSLGERA